MTSSSKSLNCFDSETWVSNALIWSFSTIGETLGVFVEIMLGSFCWVNSDGVFFDITVIRPYLLMSLALDSFRCCFMQLVKGSWSSLSFSASQNTARKLAQLIWYRSLLSFYWICGRNNYSASLVQKLLDLAKSIQWTVVSSDGSLMKYSLWLSSLW